MTYLGTCGYCQEMVRDAHYHKECRIAYLEDIMYQLKKALRRAKGKDLPEDLRKLIMDGNWQPLPDFLKERIERNIESNIEWAKKEIYQQSKRAFLEQQAEKFDKRHSGKKKKPKQIEFGAIS